MRRVFAAAFALCIATSAFAQSGLLPANQVWAGPPSGGQGFARARALVGADVPAPGASSLGGVQSLTCSSSNWFRTLSTSGVLGCSQPAITDISGLGAGVATALGIAPGSAGAPVLFNGAGGTPSSLVATNATGTAAGLTAGHVTTNANQTGDCTSVGNATNCLKTNSVAFGPGATVITAPRVSICSTAGTSCVSGGFTGSSPFVTSTSPPTIWMEVFICGPGAVGGAGFNPGTLSGGGGGGAGGNTWAIISAPLSTYAFTNAAGSTTFGTSLLAANAGGAGAAGTTNAGGPGGAGGAATGGNPTSGNGGASGAIGATGVSGGAAGVGGASPLGGAGIGGNNGAGSAGATCSGGGGGSNGAAGGAASSGYLKVVEHFTY